MRASLSAGLRIRQIDTADSAVRYRTESCTSSGLCVSELQNVARGVGEYIEWRHRRGSGILSGTTDTSVRHNGKETHLVILGEELEERHNV
jgi:hypothetical protein